MDLLPTQKQVETAQEINTLLDGHRVWMDRLNKTLICGTTAAEDTIAENAHHQCRVGKWLEQQARALFADKTKHDVLLARHKQVHDHARAMVTSAQRGDRINEDIYDGFLEAALEFEQMIESAYDTLMARINATDPLTGAQTRSHMRALLEDRLIKSRDGGPSWIVMVDLDHFKSINDRYGHDIGDQVLKGFASVVRDHIRANDLFFRYGGEEFLLCISDVSEDTIMAVAERLRQAISNENHQLPEGHSISVTASFGITELTEKRSVTEAISTADVAMYAAKHAGRNRVMFETAPASPPPAQSL